MRSIARDGDTVGPGGKIITKAKNVFIGGKLVSNVGDPASADALCIPLGGAHCGPSTTSGLTSVIVGEA